MLTADEYSEVISELLDELPEEFFRELSGGVIVSDEVRIPSYAEGDDIWTMGHYQVSYGVRQIVMFRGSFERIYPHAGKEEAKRILRGVLRHEFRHHIEFLGGLHDRSTLEAEDERKKKEYIARHRKEKGKD